VTPTVRAIGEGLPYIRLVLPSGRSTVVRTYRASFALKRLQTVISMASIVRDEAEATLGLPASEALAARAAVTERGEGVTGHLIGSVWSDPDWALTSWDDSALFGDAFRLGAAVVAELDEAGWSAADIGALAVAARAILSSPDAPDLAERAQAAASGATVAPSTAGARIAEEVKEQADFSDAPRA
jgi:hypothetical protein